MKKIYFLILFNIFFLLSFKSWAESKNYISEINPFNLDGSINAVVEIPAGTLEKWEVSKDGSQIKQEINDNKKRVIDYLAYPFNYGFIPQTFLPGAQGGDGDPLDIIIIGESIDRGSVLKVKPIGTIILLDNNEIDSKVIGLMVNDLNISSSNSIGDLEKNYSGVMEIIKLWMQNYKGEILEIKRILGRKATKDYIKTYHKKFLSINK